MKTLPKHFLSSFMVFAILFSSSKLYAQTIQNWEISILDQAQRVQATASMQCLTGGACDVSS